MLTKLFLAAVFIIGVAAACPLMAADADAPKEAPKDKPAMKGHCPMGMHKCVAMLSKLNLTAEQKTAVDKVFEKYHADLVKAHEGVKEKVKALMTAVTADKPDEKAIRAASEDLSKAIGDAAVLRSKIHVDLLAVLTAEQVKKLKDLREEHMKKMDEMCKKMCEKPAKLGETPAPAAPVAK